MSKVILAAWNIALRKGLRPYQQLPSCEVKRQTGGIDLNAFILQSLNSTCASRPIVNYSALVSKCMPVAILSSDQQIRQMSWGNVHKPMPRPNRRPNRHKDPKTAKLRKWKVFKIDLPDHEFERKMKDGRLSPEEIRAELKLKGMLPPSQYSENPVYLAATGAIFEEYEPPDGDGKADWPGGTKEKYSEKSEDSSWGLTKSVRSQLEKAKAKTFRATRKLRTFDDNFDASSFASQEAQEIYINAHNALAAKQEKRLHQLATEKAFPEMMFNTKGRSIYWEFLKSLEAPQVVQVRCQDIISKGNVFAQVTVRFHTQQILAVYDRFGRLIHGNPYVSKDVLEYVVFEKHMAETYGKWRLHAKIIPDWLANSRSGGIITNVFRAKEADDESKAKEGSEEDKEDEEEESNEKKYGVSYKSDEKPVSIFNKFGKLIGRSKS